MQQSIIAKPVGQSKYWSHLIYLLYGIWWNKTEQRERERREMKRESWRNFTHYFHQQFRNNLRERREEMGFVLYKTKTKKTKRRDTTTGTVVCCVLYILCMKRDKRKRWEKEMSWKHDNTQQQTNNNIHPLCFLSSLVNNPLHGSVIHNLPLWLSFFSFSFSSLSLSLFLCFFLFLSFFLSFSICNQSGVWFSSSVIAVH